MALQGSTKVAPSLNYHQVNSSEPTYHYRKLTPANGGSTTITLASSGATDNSIFNIPVEVVNMGESFLEYTLTIPDQGANNYAWLFRDVPNAEFQQVQYRDTGTMYVVDVRNQQYYSHGMSLLNYSDEKLEYSDDINGLVKTNAPLSDVKCKQFDNTIMSIPFVRPQELQVSAIGTGAGNAIVKTKRIKLKDLVPDSFFGLAKNCIFPVETYLDIIWNFSNLGFQGTSGTDPTAGVAKLTGNITITNMCLRLAVEQNQDLVKAMKAEIGKGLTMAIPWVKVHTLVQSSAAPYTYNLPLDKAQHGKKLKKVVYLPYIQVPAAGAWNTLYNHSNVSGATMATYYTELDNQRLQRDILTSTNNDDFMIHKKILLNSSYKDKAHYYHEWFHMDSFDYSKEGANHNKEGFVFIDGYDLVKPVNYTVNVLTGNASAPLNVCIVHGEKILSINPASYVVL